MQTKGKRSLTHWGLNKMVDIFQTTFSNAFSWIKMTVLCLVCFYACVGAIDNMLALCQYASIVSLECYFGVYFPRCFATREMNTKITLSSALKQFVTWVHTLFSIYATCCHKPGNKNVTTQSIWPETGPVSCCWHVWDTPSLWQHRDSTRRGFWPTHIKVTMPFSPA